MSFRLPAQLWASASAVLPGTDSLQPCHVNGWCARRLRPTLSSPCRHRIQARRAVAVGTARPLQRSRGGTVSASVRSLLVPASSQEGGCGLVSEPVSRRQEPNWCRAQEEEAELVYRLLVSYPHPVARSTTQCEHLNWCRRQASEEIRSRARSGPSTHNRHSVPRPAVGGGRGNGE